MDDTPKTFLEKLITKFSPPKSTVERAQEIASRPSTAALESQVDDIRDNIDDFQGEDKEELELQLKFFEKELAGRSDAA